MGYQENYDKIFNKATANTPIILGTAVETSAKKADETSSAEIVPEQPKKPTRPKKARKRYSLKTSSPSPDTVTPLTPVAPEHVPKKADESSSAEIQPEISPARKHLEALSLAAPIKVGEKSSSTDTDAAYTDENLDGAIRRGNSHVETKFGSPEEYPKMIKSLESAEEKQTEAITTFVHSRSLLILLFLFLISIFGLTSGYFGYNKIITAAKLSWQEQNKQIIALTVKVKQLEAALIAKEAERKNSAAESAENKNALEKEQEKNAALIRQLIAKAKKPAIQRTVSASSSRKREEAEFTTNHRRQGVVVSPVTE